MGVLPEHNGKHARAAPEATDTAVASAIDASQPAMRSGFMQSVVPLSRPLDVKEGDMEESWRR